MKRKRQLVRLADRGGALYLSAVVLGMNDALVELTAALAGFTMALQDNRLIILAGLTTGVAATLSMGASEYLAQEAETGPGNSLMAALYTGMAYLATVTLLLLPYFICPTPLHALIVCLVLAGLIIAGFTFITSRLRGTSYRHDCLQMLIISFCVAAIAFAISWGAKALWGLDI